MITFMQKNKKYLVVTIWVSVIAFVGASFVGWGSVDLNFSRSNSVAKVGNLSVTKNEFQRRYSEVFNILSQNNGGALDEETALQLGVDKAVLGELIRKKLLLNYAHEIGFGVSDLEVANYINQQFGLLKDGTFDKDTYSMFLKQIGMTASEYEKNIKDEILVNKVFSLFNLKNNEEELELYSSSIFMQDLLGVRVLEIANAKVTELEIKEFWENTKQDYKTDKTYEISMYIEPVVNDVYEDSKLLEHYNENKIEFSSFENSKDEIAKHLNTQITKKQANRSYVALKNGEKTFDIKKIISVEDADIFGIAELLGVGDISRPFEYNNTYAVIRLDLVNESREKTFDEAKDEAKARLIEQKTKEELKVLAQNYNGSYKNIGLVNRDTTKSTSSGLSETEFISFVSEVFGSDKMKSYVMLDNKAVAYNVLEQNLINDDKMNFHRDILDKSLVLLKSRALMEEVLEDLQKRYPVNIYYGKGK